MLEFKLINVSKKGPWAVLTIGLVCGCIQPQSLSNIRGCHVISGILMIGDEEEGNVAYCPAYTS